MDTASRAVSTSFFGDETNSTSRVDRASASSYDGSNHHDLCSPQDTADSHDSCAELDHKEDASVRVRPMLGTPGLPPDQLEKKLAALKKSKDDEEHV